MRGKTVKRLAILIVVFMLVAGSAFAIWKIQVGRMAQGVVEQADRAVENKEFEKAVDFYQQHLLVFPNDKVVQEKYADILLKLQPTPKTQSTVLGIYLEILNKEPGRDDVRRKVAELALDMPVNMFDMARKQLEILLKSAPKDGHLEFMMGRCYQEDNDLENAAAYFRRAIEHGAPERIEASLRLATLIRENGKLGNPQEADKVMDEMVAADPGDYRVYLERGHYRRRFDLEGAGADFLKSLELAPDRAEIFVEFSQLAERDKAMDEARRILDEHRPFTLLLPSALDVARRILEDGQAALPRSPTIHLARADLERKAGRVDRYIELLEEGTKKVPQNVALRLQLAWVLAAQGDTSKLMLHIEELKGLGLSRVVTDYLTAYYHVNNKEFEKARFILAAIQSEIAQTPELKARVNVLLAKCYGQLHDPDREWEANQRAYNANPTDPAAQEAWIVGFIGRLVKRGRIDEAIKEYRRQLEQTPQLPKMQLVRLLIGRNRQRPPAQRDWREVESLLDEMVKVSPKAVEPVVLRAMLNAEQDQPAKALEALEAARLRFPEAVEPWSAEAEVLVRQKKFDEALGRLDLAQKQLDGDRIELRLNRATIWAGRGAPKEVVVKVLKGLAEDVDRFPKQKRKILLSYLAGELAARQELRAAEGLWARLAEDDPKDVEPHVQLFDLALKAAEKATDEKKEKADIAALDDVIAKAKGTIEAQIKAMEAIDPILGRFYEARYLTWRAAPSKGEMQGKKPRAEGAEPPSQEQVEKKKLRAEAREILAELKKRREEWEQIPLTEAILDQQSLSQEDLDEAERREKQESLLNHCLAAIELGSRSPDLVRLGVELLFAAGRSGEAIQLFNRMAEFTQLGGELGQRVAQAAIAQNNEQAPEVTRKAEEAARAAVAANPGSFKEQRWLAQILVVGKRYAEAETVLRSAVDQDKGDPDRWGNLVGFLVLTKQLPQAAQALRDAQKRLTDAPLTLADCCERIGKASEGPDAAVVAKKWYDEARGWYDTALDARKETKERSATLRLLVQFLDRTDPPAAEEKLRAILAQPDGAPDDLTLAWCRRVLAAYYLKSSPRRADKALALFQAAGPRGTGTTPEDSRVRAQVLAAQGTPEHYREAIAILQSLVDEKLATPEDRHMLGQIAELSGDWPKARVFSQPDRIRHQRRRRPGAVQAADPLPRRLRREAAPVPPARGGQGQGHRRGPGVDREAQAPPGRFARVADARGGPLYGPE